MKKVPVSERALFARVTRALAKDEKSLKKSKPNSRLFQDLGQYYVVDVRRNAIAAKGCDLVALARDLGVIAGWERLES